MTTTELDQAWLAYTNPPAAMDTRASWEILLEAAAAGWHPERMQRLITVASHSMDLNPADPMYGNLGINYGAPVPTDNNVGVFCMQCAAATWELYRANLPADAQASLSATMTLGLKHVLSYVVYPNYTNIYLLKAFDAIALGEGLGDAAAASTGYAMLDTFISYTKANGVGEFLSPTYYGVDLEAMAMTQRLAQLPAGRADAVIIQNLLWSDIAANWFSPTEVIAGAHGRDHDYLHGHGKCDVQLQLAGWLKNRTPDMEDFPSSTSTYFTLAGSAPPASVAAILQQMPRTVSARWGTNQRTTYISNHVSLASSSGSYTFEDKLLNMNMAGTSDATVNLSYVLDGINDPYGVVATSNTVGNVSIQHLTPRVMAMQTGPDALFVVSEELASGSKGFSVLSGVHSNFLLPNGGSIWVGNSPVALPAAGTQLSISSALPIFVHYGDAAVAIRIVYADTATGAAATVALVNDGSAYHACRLLIEHSAGIPSASVNVQLAVHVEVADGLTSAGFNAFRTSMMANTYAVSATASLLDVTATTSSGPLHLALNLSTNQPSVLGYTPTTSVLTVNGADIGTPILNSTAAAPPAVVTSGSNSPPATSTPPVTDAPPAAATSVPVADTGASSTPVAGDTSGGHGCGLGSGVGLLVLALGARMRSNRKR